MKDTNNYPKTTKEYTKTSKRKETLKQRKLYKQGIDKPPQHQWCKPTHSLNKWRCAVFVQPGLLFFILFLFLIFVFPHGISKHSQTYDEQCNFATFNSNYHELFKHLSRVRLQVSFSWCLLKSLDFQTIQGVKVSWGDKGVVSKTQSLPAVTARCKKGRTSFLSFLCLSRATQSADRELDGTTCTVMIWTLSTISIINQNPVKPSMSHINARLNPQNK